MPKFLLPIALSVLLIPVLSAQESQETKPADPQAAQQKTEPEKKPDAFKYFFGKEREQRKAPEAPAPAPEAAAPAQPSAARSEVRPEPPTVAQPEIAPPAPAAPQPAPKAEPPRKAEETPKAEEPKVDAFQYFFGHAAQPLPEPEKVASPGKPVSAFDYFFGKDGKADQPEEPASPPPV